MIMMNTDVDDDEYTCVISMEKFDLRYAFFDEQERCFDARLLQKWFVECGKFENPFTGTIFSDEVVERITQKTCDKKGNESKYEALYCNEMISLPDSMANLINWNKK